MTYKDIKIPYDMKCANCNHTASDHWWSYHGQLSNGNCASCMIKDINSSMFICHTFIFDNLNYVEIVAEHREQNSEYLI